MNGRLMPPLGASIFIVAVLLRCRFEFQFLGVPVVVKVGMMVGMLELQVVDIQVMNATMQGCE